MSEYFPKREPSRVFDDEHISGKMLEYPRLSLIASTQGGLNRLMRTVEAVQNQEAA